MTKHKKNIVIGGGGIWINGVKQTPDFELSNRLVVNGVVYKNLADFIRQKLSKIIHGK